MQAQQLAEGMGDHAKVGSGRLAMNAREMAYRHLGVGNISRSHSAAILIGVSACIALYAACTVSSVAGAIQARQPRWLRRYLAALQPFQIDVVPATHVSATNTGEWRDETVPALSTNTFAQ